MTKSLQDSLVSRDELQKQTEQFAQEIVILQQQLSETANVIKQHQCVQDSSLDQNKNNAVNETKANPDNSKVTELLDVKEIDENQSETLNSSIQTILGASPPPNLESEYLKIEETLNSNQLSLMNELKIKINLFLQQKVVEIRNSQQDEMKFLKVRYLFTFKH